ncbi:nucleotide sugar dehydrogenase [Rossellomorea sp. NPDC077527]|uniref:nucleotide sugar dehydrogenase n=1 Tax=Rossellomorea sp. NPDC077527 TaxID=3364510 RepID=UPI0037CC6DE9
MKLCVLGLGYIGLPTAVMFAQHGLEVLGVDINENVINNLKNRTLHIEEPGLRDRFNSVIDSGRLTVSTVPTEADVYMIAVPTPITKDKKADLSYVISATESIIPFLQKDNLIILESTVPPRTTEDILVPLLSQSGYKVGVDLLVSHSPERVLPGRLFEELIENDRIVGGINEESCLKTVFLYKNFVKGNIHMTDAKTAEMVKLIENTYRDVNIALANELAVISEQLEINIWDAIKLANHHPRVHLHSPSSGVGGHCIPIDPWFLIEKAPNNSDLICLARKINDSMPFRIIEIIESTVKNINNPCITLCGISYKGNIDDIRESPTLKVYHELIKRGYSIKLHDPLVNTVFPDKFDSLENALLGSDCLVIMTDHTQYRNLNLVTFKDLFKTLNIIDTKNILNHKHLMMNGFYSIQIGTPNKNGG